MTAQFQEWTVAELRPVTREPLPLRMQARSGSILARQGERSTGPWVIERGVFREFSIGPDGRELVVALLGPGELATGPEGERSPTTVRAIRPARVRTASRFELAALLAARERRTVELATALAWEEIPDRLERRLRELAERFGRRVPGGITLSIPLTQEELAALIGASREGTNRALRVLATRGRVQRLRRGRYLLPNPLRLVEPS
jgi:CRP/FNR family cyclic AMP-dependent transcriptional regulator